MRLTAFSSKLTPTSAVALMLSAMVLLFSASRAFNPSQTVRRVSRQGRAVSSTRARALYSSSAKNEKNPWSDSITLPKTTFDLRANAIKTDKVFHAKWQNTDFRSVLEGREKTWTLHDGPPYANGPLHIGHAMNKILKDFINRNKLLQGYNVRYIPGWDCHGLPIELKVLQEVEKENKKNKNKERLSSTELRLKAREFADRAIQTQKEGFVRYGIFGDFDSVYYRTMDTDFEVEQLNVFKAMWKKGSIYRGEKPVNWSPSSRTALAEAELEYPEGGHNSRSVYVGFVVDSISGESPLASFLREKIGSLRLAIWTTTPWTLPANLAVAVNADIIYALVSIEGHPGDCLYVVASDLVESLAEKIGASGTTTLKTFSGRDLVDSGISYEHPTRTSFVCNLLEGGDYITTDSGTGLVHTAPGHGAEDYLLGQKQDPPLPPFSPVDDAGKFNELAEPKELVGLPVLTTGSQAVIDLIGGGDSPLLLKEENYNHKYPYDWRTKKPTIFRSTPQWFCGIEGFRGEALSSIEEVKWIPEMGERRMRSFVESRGDWCISRQRSWGVPIPVFYDTSDSTKVLLDEEVIDHVIGIVASHPRGTDAWFELDEVDLLPEKYKQEAKDGKWRKGTDTMDVWFDSGTSWSGVLGGKSDNEVKADMYLEGSDQHRGWFQSSLLTSVASRGIPPYKTVLTHGFVLDEKGFKMSKSLGNVVDPMSVIEGGNDKKKDPAYGADVLRLWVASVDYTGDVCIGSNVMKQTFESYRRIRNVARYLLGNLFDFQQEDRVPYADLPSLDKWILGRLSVLLRDVRSSYDEYQFNKAVNALLKFVTADLSNFYLDIAKDRLYISGTDDFRRRSCQTVLVDVLEGLTKCVAPLLPHMAEDIHSSGGKERSVFEEVWPAHLEEFEGFGEDEWKRVREVREDVNKALEIARNDKAIGASLDARAVIYVDDDDHDTERILRGLMGIPVDSESEVDDLKYVLMLSQVEVVKGGGQDIGEGSGGYFLSKDAGVSGCAVRVDKAEGKKCERCWFFDETVGSDKENNLCKRCNEVIAKKGAMV